MSYEVLISDLNGESHYNDLRAAFGYISPNERLQVTKGVIDKCQGFSDPQQHINLTLDEGLEIMYLNFAKLCQGGIEPKKAIRIAALRLCWIADGNLMKSREDRKTPINEVDVVEPPDIAKYKPKKTKKDLIDKAESDEEKKKDKAPKFKLEGSPDPFPVAFNEVDFPAYRMVASNYFGIVAHVFRARGHHYKLELQKLYEDTFKGTTLSHPDNVLAWQEISRTAIHSFGVACLEKGADFYCKNNALTHALVLRRDSIPCGSALVGTAAAVLRQLASLPWFKEISAPYEDVIRELTREYEKIKDAGIKSHINAKLYGYERLKINTSPAEVLAPILVGYISALKDNVAIKEQKALLRPADDNPLMVRLMKDWLMARVEEAAGKPVFPTSVLRIEAEKKK